MIEPVAVRSPTAPMAGAINVFQSRRSLRLQKNTTTVTATAPCMATIPTVNRPPKLV